MICAAQEEGAGIAAGAHKANIPGAFLEPTVLTDVLPEMSIAQEEVFGPVVSVLKFSTDGEAIQHCHMAPSILGSLAASSRAYLERGYQRRAAFAALGRSPLAST